MAGTHHVIENMRQMGSKAARACILAAGCALLIPAAGPTPALAGDAPAGTIITVGGYGIIGPKFEGSKHDELSFRPSVSWRGPNDRVWLDLPNDGLDFSVIEGANYRAGVVGNLRWQRHAEDVRPRGFKKVGSADVSIEAGAFAEYWPSQALRTRVELRDAFFGAEGLIADFSADVVLHPAQRWTLTGGPRLSIADQTFMDSYYSINAAQAATSGLAQFKADAGIRSYGAGVSARYQLTDDILTIGYVEYQRLAGSASDSPLIDDRGSPDQVTIGLGMKYSFRAPW
jgi:MipA family protein